MPSHLPSLHELLIDRLGAPTGPARDLEPWVSHEYSREAAAKDEALALWWKQNALPGRPSPLIRAPQPRGYRSVCKRRVVVQGSRVFLLFNRRPPENGSPLTPPSRLEPETHAALLRFLGEKLQQPRLRGLAADINFLIVTGSGRERSLTINLAAGNRSRHQNCEQLARECRKMDPGLISAFLHYDPSRSAYYRETSRLAVDAGIRRIFGPSHLRLDLNGLRLHYPAGGFCQVNPPILPDFVAAASTLLDFPADGSGTLLDLYCGFGLFAVTLGTGLLFVNGVESYPPAVSAALENLRRNRPRQNAQILAGRLDGRTVQSLLPPHPRPGERILLDPPREGTLPGVIEGLARRRSERVLHIACRLSTLPAELARWRNGHYAVDRVQPVDMFAGTSEIETLISLKPA